MNTDDTIDLLNRVPLRTPAFVVDLGTLAEDAATLRTVADAAGVRPLFALKSFSFAEGLRTIAGQVDGFAASSLFEARLGRALLGPEQTIHLTTPGLRTDELDALCAVADYISFNSLGQWERCGATVRGRVHCGLRINPQLSFVEDERYDPCRRHSKLGIPLEQLRQVLRHEPGRLAGIDGLHFHSNCDAEDLAPWLQTVERVVEELDPLFDQLAWVNLGGGYLLRAPAHPDALTRAAEHIRARRSCDIFIEPGASVARRAGYMIASVVDLFDSGGKTVAVLDTSTNHMPEVFEYQFAPDVAGDCEDGQYEYLLAGAACLAGDLFGEYAFHVPLQVGTRVIFPDMGAYSLVKAHMFNGINLPTLYSLEDSGELREVMAFGFDDFLRVCGVTDASDL